MIPAGANKADGTALGGGFNISGASESFCCSVVSRLAASYRWRHSWQHAIESHPATNGGFIPAAGAQESCRTHSPARLTSAAAASGAEKLSSRHVLPRDLSNALKQLDDGELGQLFAAIRHELQRRGRSLRSTRPTTHVATEQRTSDQPTTTEESPERREPEEP